MCSFGIEPERILQGKICKQQVEMRLCFPTNKSFMGGSFTCLFGDYSHQFCQKKKAAPKTRPRKARACTHKGLQIQALSTALAQNALIYDCTIPAQVASGSLATISNKSALLLHKQSNVRWDWA